VSYEQLTITTRDGQCPAYVCTPGTGKKAPAVVMYMDAAGVRPALIGMAERLSAAGYVVLLPDLFYRYGPYGPFDPKEVFKGDFRAILGPLYVTTSNAKAAEDTEAFLAYLDTRSDVQGEKMGAVGFCMGGGMAIAAAGTWPDRFAAVASFHGGNLATEASDSPHGFAPRLKAELYIAVAENDATYPPTMAEKFEHALRDANVTHRAETYPAPHGWMKTDFPVYNEVEAEHGWHEMSAFFGRTCADLAGKN
jgi:carboxymethylenebutenolidase